MTVPAVEGPLLRVLVVGVLALNATLLALTELLWLPLRVGTLPLPLSAPVAAVTTPLLVLAARAAMPGTRAGFVVLTAWLVPVLVVGLWSPAGPGLLSPDWRGILLLGCGLVPGLLAAHRPGTP